LDIGLKKVGVGTVETQNLVKYQEFLVCKIIRV